MLIWLLACRHDCPSRFEAGLTETLSSGPVTFTREVVTTTCGPAYVEAGDLDGDGAPELVVSSFGTQRGLSVPEGAVRAYRAGAQGWSEEPLLEGGVKWPNEALLDDLDGDGDLDVMVGAGFLTCQLNPWTAACGALFWLENGAGWARRDVVAPGADLFYHRPLLTDVDGDGRRDLLAVGESLETPFGTENRAELELFLGTDDVEWFDGEPISLGEGGGSLPGLYDVDGDGDEDVVSAQYFVEGATAVWMERPEDPLGPWPRHTIDGDRGPAIQASVVPDLLGDGRPVVVGANHVNNTNDPPDPWPPEVTVYPFPEDPTQPWTGTTLADDFVSLEGTGVAAPGVFSWGDIDGDGDIDLLVSGDGDEALYWLENRWQQDGGFEQHVLEVSLPTAGGNRVVDLDGDGADELLVAAYEDNAVLLYRRAP